MSTDSGAPPIFSLPVRLGRKEGILVEADRSGARVRHSGALKLGGEAQLSFVARGEVFTAVSQVLACRVVGLGLGAGGSTLFESKVQFTEAKAGEVVERLMGAADATTQPA